jgi:hypothetical protein
VQEVEASRAQASVQQLHELVAGKVSLLDDGPMVFLLVHCPGVSCSIHTLCGCHPCVRLAPQDSLLHQW